MQTQLEQLELELRRKALESHLKDVRSQIDKLWHEQAKTEDQLNELETQEQFEVFAEVGR